MGGASLSLKSTTEGIADGREGAPRTRVRGVRRRRATSPMMAAYEGKAKSMLTNQRPSVGWRSRRASTPRIAASESETPFW
jgi:hypothetical protein